MTRSLFAVLPLALAAAFIMASNAFACACCAEKGTWRVSIISSAKVVAAIRATRKVTGIAAVGDPGSRHEPEEARKVRMVSAAPHQIVLAAGKGKIVLRLSKTAVFREIDITFAAGRGGAGGAKLLKTYNVLGTAQLSGDFAKLFGAKAVRASVAVFGVGNNCPGGQDMKRWQIRFRHGSRTVGHASFPADN